jgi:hypothetical protein
MDDNSHLISDFPEKDITNPHASACEIFHDNHGRKANPIIWRISFSLGSGYFQLRHR